MTNPNELPTDENLGIERGQKPRHIHDCESCLFIGIVNDMDAYIHNRDYGTEYLLRYGDEAPDYYSALDGRDKALSEEVAHHSYSETFSREFIVKDRYRQVLVKLHSGAIATSMGRI